MAGYKWREDREMERLALFTAHLINFIGQPKRPVSPVLLLGRQDTHGINTGEPRMTPEELEASKQELIERLGG